jgi:hypothetical protein
MISQRKLDANRRNALKSTGPKTDAGKAVSSQNGITHGLTSRNSPIMPGEDQAEYDMLRDAMIADLKPVGMMQREIVMDLINIRWKLQRVPLIEAAVAERRKRSLISAHRSQVLDGEVPKDSQPALDPISILAAEFVGGDDAFARLELYRQRLERSMYTAIRTLRKLREETGNEDETSNEDEVEPSQPLAPIPQTNPSTPSIVAGKTEPTDSHNLRVAPGLRDAGVAAAIRQPCELDPLEQSNTAPS